MTKFKKKPVVIEAITWDEFIEHGHRYIKDHPNKGNYGAYEKGNGIGLPWSFKYNGHSITHENDECYILITLEGTEYMTPKDMLITGIRGEIYPCKIDIFNQTYDIV